MASPLRLSVAPDGLPEEAAEVVAEAAWTIVLGTFEVAEAAMSRFRAESDLTWLNRSSPAAATISRPLERALVAADRARRITGGRFDPRIVGALERIGYVGVSQAGTGAARARRAPDGSRILDRHGRTGRVGLPCPVDLGGIGKGLALRWAATALDASVVGAGEPPIGYLLEAGGDIVAAGSPGGGEPWLVGIEDPVGGPQPVAVVEVRDRGAVATSSVRRLRWEHEGRIVHHLIDPRTGRPGGDGLAAVTVAAPDPAWAEVWSKALFLDGARGIASGARARGLATWWVTTDGAVEMTPAARLRTAWVAGEVRSP
ncbi:MAG: FAD:protein FMN transferase [Chloroflexota bacterium]